MTSSNIKLVKIGEKYIHHFTINENLYLKFLNISNDNNPMHISDIFARSHGFDSKIVHGNILSIFLSYLIGVILPIKNIVIISQKIFFKNPIYVNDQISLNAKIIAIHKSVNVFELKFSFEKEHNICIGSGSIQLKVI